MTELLKKRLKKFVLLCTENRRKVLLKFIFAKGNKKNRMV